MFSNFLFLPTALWGDTSKTNMKRGMFQTTVPHECFHYNNMKHLRNGILKQIDRGGTKLKCNFMSSHGQGIVPSSLTISSREERELA